MQLSRWLGIFFKGMGMGAADIVPGVSGGTIAFITGLYDELIDSLKAIGPKTLLMLFKEGPKAFWQAVNGNFFVCLLAGIGTSLLLLSNLILWLLAEYPLHIWSFFFGLVLASTWHLFKEIPEKTMLSYLGIIVGTAFAYLTTTQLTLHLAPTPVNFFIGGGIAICAMILPGISGSFLLVLLGLYIPVLTAIKSMDVTNVLLFMSGALIGILVFVRLLSWLLHHYRSGTLSVLVGFLLGSLTVLWPWKQVITWRESSSGLKPLVQENITPMQYTELTQQEPFLLQCIMAAIVGFALILFIERLTLKPHTKVSTQAKCP